MPHRIQPCHTAFLLTVLLAAAAPAKANTICTQPLEPVCVNMDTTYRDQSEVASCREDVVKYRQEFSGYLGCLEKQKTEGRNAVARLVETFERRSKPVAPLKK